MDVPKAQSNSVLLVAKGPVGADVLDRAAFGPDWTWIQARDGWHPDKCVFGEDPAFRWLLIFSEGFADGELLELCAGVRRHGRMQSVRAFVVFGVRDHRRAQKVAATGMRVVFCPVSRPAVLLLATGTETSRSREGAGDSQGRKETG